MAEASHFDRTKALIAANIDICEKRLKLLLSFPDEESTRYVSPLAPLVQESLDKLKEHKEKSKHLRSESSKAEYVETSIELLETLSNQVSAFDEALKKTKWGRGQLTKLRKRIQ